MESVGSNQEESAGSNKEVSAINVAAAAMGADCIIVFDRLLFRRLCSFQSSVVPETPTVCASTRSPGSILDNGSILDDDCQSDSGSESGGGWRRRGMQR